MNDDYRFTYPDPADTDFLGLAAKGNIVIGDYTHDSDGDGRTDFQEIVVPKLRPGPTSITQPYVIDPSDGALGYHDNGYDAQGRPRFSGDYDQQDRMADGSLGVKQDGSPRKFYESSLPDGQFSSLVDQDLKSTRWRTYWDDYRGEYRSYRVTTKISIDGVLYTNHAVAGMVKSTNLNVNGAILSRDDALMFRDNFTLNHDVRLMDKDAEDFILPFAIQRPRLIQWQEVYE